MKIKIPKAIWAIIATIAIAVSCFFVLPSFWFWVCWEVLAAGMVAVGCGGEWYLFLTPAKEGHEQVHRRRELQFITGVALGVAMEFLALAHAIPEALRLERDVALANERASLTESNNLTLRSKVANLQLKARARFWGFDASVFENALKGKPMAKVELLYQKDDLESYDFAAKIKRALNDAGWMTIGVRPILESDALYPASPPVQMPLIVRAGGGLAGGIGIISKKPPGMTKMESPADALMNALSLAGLKNGHPAQKTFLRTVDPRLSDDDLLKLVIGSNYSGPLLDE